MHGHGVHWGLWIRDYVAVPARVPPIVTVRLAQRLSVRRERRARVDATSAGDLPVPGGV